MYVSPFVCFFTYPAPLTLTSTTFYVRDKAFDEFLMAYAKAEDEIRATWVKLIKAHEPFSVRSSYSR